MYNFTKKMWIKYKICEAAVNLTLRKGHTGGGPSNRGGDCQENKDGEGFLVEK